ncbi:P-loop NTPase fold protein [Deinococcus soli (ex Cha et al. 2016)]|uniref:KAP family P-loop NTPase fold protein n=1 Tax=Deinococcus soli (ex Cha et al. 2016) TaxID=1309411 RepID=UPI001665361F|nr:P-loop NTPase fold protein [Deinococcus soli (ex Cha et al. 2016)]GGB71136.1 ATPase [Deinococcus soli (ex Cha et al. 2016)]
MWSDNESSVDLLRFTYLTDTLVELVQQDSLLPTTIGVFGDWGSGKSTILKHAESKLRAQGAGTICLTFNGWLFEGYEDAKSALMGNILEELEKQLKENRRWTDAIGQSIGKLLKRVDWLKVAKISAGAAVPMLTGLPLLGPLLGLLPNVKEKEGEAPDLTGLLKEAPEESTRTTIREFRQEFSKLLEQAGVSRLVVIIDDLDRCLPSTIIDTLEAIKLFLFAGRTAFILGADERLVEYAVRERFPELPNTDFQVGQNYLEKLVQIPLRLPTLTARETESYLALLFAQRACQRPVFEQIVAKMLSLELTDLNDVAFTPELARQVHGRMNERVPSRLDADLAFAARLAQPLHTGLGGSPRRLKRFLNALELRMTLAQRRHLDIDVGKLAKLMVLEYIKTDQFRRFVQWPIQEGGRVVRLQALEQAARAREASSPPGPIGPANEIPEYMRSWLDDDWLRTWLASDPPLGDENLVPYFTVAHDKITSLTNYASKLSPAASRLLQDLLSGATVSIRRALTQASTLDAADANAMFQALATAYRASNPADLRGIHSALFGFVGKRGELFNDLVAFLEQLPDTGVYSPAPTELANLQGGTPSGLALALINRWAESTATTLKRNAQTLLKNRKVN